MMLEAQAIDLHYGAAQALRGISLMRSAATLLACLGETALARLVFSVRSPAICGERRQNYLGGQRYHRVAATGACPARHCLCAARPGDFSAADRRRKSEDRFCAVAARRTQRARRRVLAVPGAQGHAAPARRRPLRRSAAAARDRPRTGDAAAAALLDEPTEGIQPSIIKDIGRAIAYLRSLGKIAIVLVEQYLDFARELGDYFAVMDRGAVVYSCNREDIDEAALKRAMAI